MASRYPSTTGGSSITGSSFWNPSSTDYPVSFAVGDTLHWHVDLTPAYPRGVLCSRVQARLFPAIPDKDSITHSSPHEYGVVVAEGDPSPEAVEVGREFKVSFTLLASHFQTNSTQDQYQCSFDCIPVARFPESDIDINDESTLIRVETLATSHSFALISEPTNLRKLNPPPAILDITPLQELHGFHVDCPISKKRPVLPVRIGSTVYDRDAVLTYLNAASSTGMDLNTLRSRINPSSASYSTCSVHNVLDNTCVDAVLYYKLQKYEESRLLQIITDRYCIRARELYILNLKTDKLYPSIDLGLDGDVVSYADILLRHSAGPALKEFRRACRLVSKASQAGYRLVRPLGRAISRSLTTASVVMILTLLRITARLSPAVQQAWMMDVMFNSGLVASVVHWGVTVIPQLTVFVLLHSADWAFRNLGVYNVMFDDDGMARVLGEFKAALARIKAPPATPLPARYFKPENFITDPRKVEGNADDDWEKVE